MEPELPPLPDKDPPSYRNTKYSEFLEYQKAVWRRQRVMRKRALLGTVAFTRLFLCYFYWLPFLDMNN
jgi:hypothetical protein